MTINNVSKEKLETYFKKIKRPIRMGKLLKIFKIKDYQRQEFIDLVNELKMDKTIKINNGLIIPSSYVEDISSKELSEGVIVEYFTSRKKPVTPRTIIKDLGFSCDNNLELLNDLLLNLEIKGVLLKRNDSYTLLPENSTLKVGRIRMPMTGKAFLGETVVDENNLNGCLPGDYVLVDNVRNGNTTYGVVRRIIKRNENPAPFVLKNGSLVPYGFTFKHKINFSLDELEGINDGDRIAIHLEDNPGDNTFNIREYFLIAKKKDPDVEYKTIATKYGFVTDFNKEELEELKEIIIDSKKMDLDNRVDYRDMVTITIDSENAHDMDDAISLEKLENGNRKLYVHIGHVANYIKKGSHLYKRALKNGFTSYLSGATYHMLPEEIANGICSLNENCDRLVRSYVIEYDPDGNVVDFNTHLAVINSNIKMTYENVNKVLEDNNMVPGYEPYLKLLKDLEHLSNQLDAKRIDRGCLDFASSDIEFEIDQDDKIKDFVIRDEKTAEKMIKNFMLQANENTAIYLSHLGIPLINRIHEEPEEEEIKNAVNFINTLGFKTRNLRNVGNPKSLQYILKQLSHHKEFPIISSLILRGLKRAGYSTKPIGHYGLALDHYAQVTAPIRRVVDLELQYLLDKLESGFDYSYESLVDLEKELQQIAVHVTSRELSSDNAEKETVMMNMAAYMEDHLGEYRNGVIIDIDKCGILVKTTENIIGRVSFSQVCGGKYKFDSERRTLNCKSLNSTLKIGSYVRIKVIGASKEDRTVDFAIKENVNSKKKTKKMVLKPQEN